MSIKGTGLEDFDADEIEVRHLKKQQRKGIETAQRRAREANRSVRWVPVSMPKLSILKDDQ